MRCATMIDVRCAHDAAQPRQDLLLRIGIHRRQRIVQDQDPRIDHQRARQRGPLLLAAGQRDAALADGGVVALRERSTSLSSLATAAASRDHADRGRRSVSRAGALDTERDVLGDRVGEQERLLRHEANRAAQAPSGISRTSTPSMNTVPGGGSCRRGSREISVDFPEPGRADERHGLPGSMRSDTSSSTGRSVPGYVNVRSRISMAPSRSRRARPASVTRGVADRRAPHPGLRASASMTPCRAGACW